MFARILVAVAEDEVAGAVVTAAGALAGPLWAHLALVYKLRAFVEAGLRYVVPLVASAAVSEQAAQFSVQAMGEMARALQSGE